jgi:hypothetical protein
VLVEQWLREDAKKYFNDIETLGKEDIKFLQQELKFVEAGGRFLDF